MGCALYTVSCSLHQLYRHAWVFVYPSTAFIHYTPYCTSLQGMDRFMALLKSKARPLTYLNQLVTGPAYAGLVRAYVRAINEGAVPQLVTAWQGVARAENERALDAAVAAYRREFKETTDDQKLYEEHQVTMKGWVQASTAQCCVLSATSWAVWVVFVVLFVHCNSIYWTVLWIEARHFTT